MLHPLWLLSLLSKRKGRFPALLVFANARLLQSGRMTLCLMSAKVLRLTRTGVFFPKKGMPSSVSGMVFLMVNVCSAASLILSDVSCAERRTW